MKLTIEAAGGADGTSGSSSSGAEVGVGVGVGMGVPSLVKVGVGLAVGAGAAVGLPNTTASVMTMARSTTPAVVAMMRMSLRREVSTLLSVMGSPGAAGRISVRDSSAGSYGRVGVSSLMVFQPYVDARAKPQNWRNPSMTGARADSR
jgi:hypothetical protein